MSLKVVVDKIILVDIEILNLMQINNWNERLNLDLENVLDSLIKF